MGSNKMAETKVDLKFLRKACWDFMEFRLIEVPVLFINECREIKMAEKPPRNSDEIRERQCKDTDMAQNIIGFL